MKKAFNAVMNFIKITLGTIITIFGATGYAMIPNAETQTDRLFFIIFPTFLCALGIVLIVSFYKARKKKKAPQPKQVEVQSQRTNDRKFSNQTKREISLTPEEMERIEKHFKDRYEAFLKSPNNQNGKESYHALCLEYKPEKFDAPSASFIEDLLERYSYKYLDPALNHQKSTVDSEETAGSFEDLSNLRRVFDEAYAEYLKNPCVDGSIILDVLENQYHPDDLPEPEALYFRRLEAEYRGAFNDATKEKRIGMMDGIAFENFCVALLKANGFTDVQTTAVSGDQGVDIVAVKDSIRYAVQCKCYSHPLGNTPVQEVNAGKAFYNCHVGVVMTNQTFTQGGIDLAAKTQTLLWGMDKLLEMMEAVKVDVTFEPKDVEAKE